MNHAFDKEALETWLFPINKPLRDYQYNIVLKALFSNTLVALPTVFISFELNIRLMTH